MARNQPAENPPPAENAAAANAQPAPAVPEVPLKFVTLGSLDRDTGYRMLLTLTNQGAAVRRAELNSPRFLDLNDFSGYLGHLELEDTPAGVKVRAVGAGTPADKAGLKVDDVITKVQRTKGEPAEIKTVDQFEAQRTQTKPGQDFVLTIVRGDAAPQPLTAKLVRRPLEVMRPEIDNIRMRNGTVPPDFVDPPSFLTSMTTLGGVPLEKAGASRSPSGSNRATGKSLRTMNRRSRSSGRSPRRPSSSSSATRSNPCHAGSRQDPDYPGYNLKLDVEVENTGDAKQSVAYRLDGPTGLPLEGWWYTHKISQRWFSAAGLRDVVVRFRGQPEQQIDCATIADDKAQPMGQGASLAYVGVDAVYFSAVFVPVKTSLEEDWFDSTEAIRIGPRVPVSVMPTRFTNVSCRMTRKPVELAPGQSQKDSYVVFVGPKRPELLAQYKAADDPELFAQRYPLLRHVAVRRRRPRHAQRAALLLQHRRQLRHRDHHAHRAGPRLHVPDQLQADAKHGPYAGAEARARPPQRKIQGRHAEAVRRPCRRSTARTKSIRSAAACRCSCSCRCSSGCTARSWSTSSCGRRRCSGT